MRKPGLNNVRKENLVSANVGDLNGCITRARASALRASGQKVPLKELSQQVQKMQRNTRRAALKENKANEKSNPCLQQKKRAVLQDVTNVFCENSYKSCFNAAKIQIKNSKWPKKGQVNVSEVDPSVTVEFPQLDTNSKVKIIQETVKREPDEVTVSSAHVKENSPFPTGATKHYGLADDCVGNQSSELPSKPQSSLRKAYKSTFSGSLMKSTDLEYIDIDLDLKDPQLCSIYASDIYNNLRAAELSQRPCSNFMETVQQDITQSMRGILVDWLVEVSEEYQLVPDTLYLTVHLVDCVLSQNYIERRRLQLLGITCMLIASKYEEICAPRVEEFCFITDNTYTREEVSKMETEVLKYLGFQICAPTSKKFLRRFVQAAHASYKSPSLELEYLTNYLAELALIDYQFLKFLPSIISASAVFLARWTLDQSSHPWNPTLEHYTTYKASELKTSVLALQDLQLNINGCPLNAVRMKYRQSKFKSVAALSSQKLLDTLF